MAVAGAYTWFWRSFINLKTWRFAARSTSFMTYLPGCSTAPGTSTACEKLTVVFLSQVSARTDGMDPISTAAKLRATKLREMVKGRKFFMKVGLLRFDCL